MKNLNFLSALYLLSFLFLYQRIAERSTGLILFIGQVTDPS